MNEIKNNNQLLIISHDALNEQSEKFVTSFDSNFLNVKLMSTNIFHDEKEMDKIKKVKAILLIVDKEKETTIETCSSILKIRNMTDVPIWLYSDPYLAIEREVFLNIGIDGFFNENQSMGEIELTILNLLRRVNDLKPEQVHLNVPKDVLIMSEEKKRKEEANYGISRNNMSVFEEKKEKKQNVAMVLDDDEEHLWVNNVEIPLSSKQYILAELLISNKNAIVDYETIYTTIWGEDYDKEKRNMVGAVVAQLRSKLERNKIRTKFIYNVPNTGYKFVIA